MTSVYPLYGAQHYRGKAGSVPELWLVCRKRIAVQFDHIGDIARGMGGRDLKQ